LIDSQRVLEGQLLESSGSSDENEGQTLEAAGAVMDARLKYPSMSIIASSEVGPLAFFKRIFTQ
jgi:hypothetical protein